MEKLLVSQNKTHLINIHKQIPSTQEDNQYNVITQRLQQILRTLIVEKAFIQSKIENQRIAFKQELQRKQSLLSILQSQNECLRHQLQEEKSKNASQLACLRKINTKLQSQRDGLTNIIQYLQLKSKELNYEMFQLRKKKNRRITQAQPTTNNMFDNRYDSQRQALLQLSKKFTLPLNVVKTENSQISTVKRNKEWQGITNKESEIEQKKSLHAIQRIRSYGLIDGTTRETIKQVEQKYVKMKNFKKRSSKVNQKGEQQCTLKSELTVKKKRFDSC